LIQSVWEISCAVLGMYFTTKLKSSLYDTLDQGDQLASSNGDGHYLIYLRVNK
jgi:hypothetical protein